MEFYFNQLNTVAFNRSAEALVDRFAYGLCGPNGTDIDSGACTPVQRSNTGFGTSRLERLWY